jgi:hypothetical protein
MNSVRFGHLGLVQTLSQRRKAQAVRRACRRCDWPAAGRRDKGAATGG